MSENVSVENQRELCRVPWRKDEYARDVGRLLPTILEGIFIELGFDAYANPIQTNGVDLDVYFRSNLILVAEILNWSISSRLYNKRKLGIIRNLNEFNCKRLFIHTVPLPNLNVVRDAGIDILEVGYQVLPEEYYNVQLARGQVIRRKIDCDSTRSQIKSKILDYVNNHLFAHKYLKFLMT